MAFKSRRLRVGDLVVWPSSGAIYRVERVSAASADLKLHRATGYHVREFVPKRTGEVVEFEEPDNPRVIRGISPYSILEPA